MAIKLYDYQEEIIQKFLKSKALLVDADTGAGKTIIGLTALSLLGMQGKIKKVLITGPVNAITSWERVSIRDPETGIRNVIHPIKILKEKYGVEVDLISLSSVWRNKLKFSDFMILKDKNKDYFLSGSYCDYDLLILDESHNVKDWKAIQTQFLLELTKKELGIEYRLLFSATPREKSKADLWSQYKIVNEDLFDTISNFNNEYCLLDERFQPFADKNSKELNKKFAAIVAPYTAVVPHEITDKYKPKQSPDVVHKVAKTEEMKEIEKKVKFYLKEHYAGTSVNIMHEASILFNLYFGYYNEISYVPNKEIPGMVNEVKTPTYFPSNKFVVLDKLVDSLEGPLILFTSYNVEIERLKAFCDYKNLEYRVIRGGVTKKNRLIIRDEFNEGTIDVLIMNIAAGSASLDLFNGKHTIFTGVNPGYIKNTQGKGRVARAGSLHDEVTNHYLITENSLEGVFYKLIQGKQVRASKMKQAILKYIKEDSS